MADVGFRPRVRHAGFTNAFPKGSIDHRILKAVAMDQFTRYSRQRPQCAFSELEVDVEEDILHNSERGRWDAVAVVTWP